MHVRRNNEVNSRNVYTSPALLTEWYHFTLKQHVWRANSACRNKMCSDLRVKCPILSPDFNQNWPSPIGFHKNAQYEISLESVQWESRWCMRIRRTDRQTDTTKVVSAFCDYANAPENWASKWVTDSKGFSPLSYNIICPHVRYMGR